MGSKIGQAVEYHASTVTQIKASKGVLHRVTVNDIGASNWQAVLFNEASVNTQFEYYSGTTNSSTDVYGVNWSAQTFTVGTVSDNQKQFISRISILAYRTGSPGNVTISIKAVDGAHKPTGSALATCTVSANAWTTLSAGAWYDFDMTTPYELTASTEYAIEVKATSGSAGNLITWLLKSTTGYAGGQHETSTNSGTAWTVSSGDYAFKEYAFRQIANLKPTVTETTEFHCFFSRGLGVLTLAGTPGSLTVVFE